MGSSQSKQTPNEAEKTPKRNKEKKTPRNSGGIRVAVTGRSGVGKSSFVNAIRGYEHFNVQILRYHCY
jgi:putative ribosome biogenesis GTPase RsgA